jgi:hypothetical protein
MGRESKDAIRMHRMIKVSWTRLGVASRHNYCKPRSHQRDQLNGRSLGRSAQQGLARHLAVDISGVLWYVDHKCMRLWNTYLNVGLNGDHYDILESPPSPVEFSRICHISRPVLIKGKFDGYSYRLCMKR